MHELYTIHKQDEWDRFHESITEWRKARTSALLLRKDRGFDHGIAAREFSNVPLPKLSVRDVGKRYDLGDGTTIEAVRDVSFDLQEGEICALLGPSGCGKSTVLRLVAGLEDRQPRGNDGGEASTIWRRRLCICMREEMRDDTNALALPH